MVAFNGEVREKKFKAKKVEKNFGLNPGALIKNYNAESDFLIFLNLTFIINKAKEINTKKKF